MTEGFSFALERVDGSARAGEMITPRARVATPAFMPVGTQATVKSQSPEDVAGTGARIVLANTYHLMLRPGADEIAALGGVGRFMAWPHAVLTDSGGYQVFSLAKLRRIDDDGVVFRSHIDGSEHTLTPERAMQVQRLLGSDIAMVLDECPAAEADRATHEAALRRTSAWARRCLAAPRAEGQAVFGIVQGGTHADLRRTHLDEIAAMDFDGIALGGYSVGEAPEVMLPSVHEIAGAMPAERPHYLMGVGTPRDLLSAIGSGIDIFDCVLPTRNARNGQAFTWNGRVNLRQRRHHGDASPLDADCQCPVCRTHSRAYLRHLVTSREMLGARLLTQHNLSFYAALMRAAREAILSGTYAQFAAATLMRMQEREEVHTVGAALR